MLEGIKSAMRRLLSYRWRSAKTGRFVSKDYAESHPDVTVRERIDL